MASTINFLRLLADPTLLRMLLLLDEEAFGGGAAGNSLAWGNQRISSHLAQLKRAGVVEDRRAGKCLRPDGKGERNPARAKVNGSACSPAKCRRRPATCTALQLALRKRATRREC